MKKRQKESENVDCRNNRRSFGGQRSENIVAFIYKSEQGLIMERAVRLNSTSLEAKRVWMFQTVTWFLFFPLFCFSFLLSLSLSLFVFFFQYNITFRNR